MLFRLATLFLAASAVAATRSQTARETNEAACDLVLEAHTTISPVTDLDAEFNYVVVQTLADETGPDSPITDAGTNHSTGIFGHFAVHTNIAAAGKTAAETAYIIQGWNGTIKQGPTTEWLVKSVLCA